jgi:hypothetical protein
MSDVILSLQGLGIAAGWMTLVVVAGWLIGKDKI